MSSVNIHAEAIYKLTPTCHSGSLAPRNTRIMYTYFTLLNHLLTSSTYLSRFIIGALFVTCKYLLISYHLVDSYPFSI